MRRAGQVVTLAVLSLLLGAARRHPMHTSVAEITFDEGTRSAAIRIRVFADDFGTALGGTPAGAAGDSAMARYVRGAFIFADRAGRTAPLRWEGIQRSGDVLLLQLRAPAPAGLSGAHVGTSLLCDRFPDQVNIIRAVYGGGSTTLLFTRGDPPKALP